MNIFTLVLGHEGFMAVYGIVAWYAFQYKIDLSKHPRMRWKVWKKENGIDIALSCIVGFGFVIFDDELLDMINDFVEDDWSLQKWYYLMPGFATGRILKWIHKEEKED